MIGRRAIHYAALSLGGLMLLLALVGIILHTPPVRRFALARAAGFLRSKGVVFEAGGVDYNLIRLSLSLRDVTIRSASAPDLPPLVTLDRLELRMDGKQLLSGIPGLRDAQVTRPAIHLVFDKGGRNNLPTLPETESTRWEPSPVVHRLLASGGSLRIEDRRQGIEFYLPHWQILATGNPSTSEHDVRFGIQESGKVSFEQRTLPVTSLAADLLVKKNSAEIRSFLIESDGSQISLSGRLADFDKPVLSLNADSTLITAPLARFAGSTQELRGTLRVKMAATGPPGQLAVHSRITGDDLAVADFTNLRIVAESRYAMAGGRIHVDSLRVSSPAGSVEADADIALVTGAGESSMHARIHALDLLPVSRALNLGTVVASRAGGTASAFWPGLSYEKAHGEARLRLTASQPQPSKGLLPLSAVVFATVRGQQITASVDSLEILAAGIKGRALFSSQGSLQGQVQVEVADLAETLRQIELYQGRKASPGDSYKLDGSARATGTIGGTLSRPQAALEVSGADLRVGDLQGATLAARVLCDPDLISLERANLEWGEQVVSARGSMDLSSKSPTLDITARLERGSLESIISGLGNPDIPTKGKLAGKARIGGTFQDPHVVVSLTGTDLQAYDESMGRLALEATYAGQSINLTRLRIDKPEAGYFEASGSFDTALKAYRINLEARHLAFRQLLPAAGMPVRAELDLTAAGAGTLDDPSLDLRMTVANLNVRQQPYGSVIASLRVAGRQADLEARAPEFNVSATATAGINDPYPAQVDIRVTELDLAKLGIDPGAQITGTLSLAAHGSLREWTQGEASASIEARARRKNLFIRTESPIRARYAGGMLSVERSTIAGANSDLQLEGRVPLLSSAPPGELRVQGNLDLAGLCAALFPDETFKFSGKASLDAAFRGDLKEISPAATLKLEGGALSFPDLNPFSNITLNARLQDGAVYLDRLFGTWASAAIESSGEIPLGLLPDDLPIKFLRKPGPARFGLDLTGLDVATVQGVPTNLGGTIALHAEAEATSTDLKSVTARLTFAQLQLGLDNLRLEQQGTSSIVVRNGIATIGLLDFAGPETRLKLSGTAGLQGERPMDLKAEGDIDAALLAVFAPAIKAQGPTALQLSLTGTAAEPRLAGFVEIRDGKFSLPSPRLAAENVHVRVNLDGDRLTFEKLDGLLNGGDMSGKGGFRYTGGSIEDLDLTLAAQNLYLSFPEGLKTVSNVDLRLRTAGREILVGGLAQITDGSYTEPIDLTTGLAGYIRSGQQGGSLMEEPDPWLSRVRFDFGVESESPLIVDNNLAKAAAGVDLRVVGGYLNPSVTGRIVLEEGGELLFSEKKYLVDRGIITFTNEQRIEPSFDILARTRAAGYDITLAITGGGEKLETALSSDPPLPDADILAILLTGRTLEEIRGSEVNIAREQMLSYLAGGLGGRLTAGLERATGLSRVRIEPNLIAAESDPSARLTVGQDITRDLRLTYSMNLANSGDQIYVAEYDATKRFTTRGIRQSDNSYRFEFRHDLRFGGQDPGKQASGKLAERRIGEVKFSGGGPYFTGEQLARRFGVRSGQKYDFFRVREGLDRIEKAYAGQHLLEARVRLARDVKETTVDLSVELEARSRVQFTYAGWQVPEKVRDEITQIWQNGVFDAQKIEDAKALLRLALIKGGYLQSRIGHDITTPAPNEKRVAFDIRPGTRYRDVRLLFPGANAIKSSSLEALIAGEKLDTALYSDPGRVAKVLTRYYHDRGFLVAEVQDPKLELEADKGSGRVLIPIREGVHFKVGEVKFTGNKACEADLLRDAIPLKSGADYEPRQREDSIRKLQDLYWNRGFADVEITSNLGRVDSGGVVDVNFDVRENRQSIIRDIRIEGNDQTGESLIRSQVSVKPGDPLTPDRLSRSRRGLYETGAFSLVDIERQPASDASLPAQPDRKPVDLRVRVREFRPFELRYGGYFDTERGPGGIVDFANHNTLGNARELGARARYDFDVREARLYFSQPLLKRFPLKTTATTFLRRDIQDVFITDSTGVTVQQEARFKEHYTFHYGYRLVRIHTFDKEPDPFFPFDVTLRVAPLTSSFTRETRDDLFDATRGSFMSQTFEWAPSFLGSQLRFIRYYGQYLKYVPLSKPAEIPWSGGIRKSRLVYAGAVRAGFARGLGGQVLVPSERFLAGGGTTIRGFQQDGVGPKDFLGNSTGGNAVFILNNELRFPVKSIFDGVGFLDVGNVYRTASDFDPTDLRKSAGFGLRVRTPYFLLRFDYGYKLDRRPGESRGQFFFSIGQAF